MPQVWAVGVSIMCLNLVGISDHRSDSEEQRLFLNYFWNMTLPEWSQVVPTWSLGIEAQGETLDQRSTFGTGAPTAIGNPNLKPEESESWEIGLDQLLSDGRALITATYFANTYKDLITFVSAPGPNWQNIQKAESSGIEAGFQMLLLWQLRLDGSYTFLETKVLNDGGIGGTAFPPGQPLLRRPKHQSSVGLIYLGERWTTAFIANVVGPALDRDFTLPDAPRVTLPGHTRLDLAASYPVPIYGRPAKAPSVRSSSGSANGCTPPTGAVLCELSLNFPRRTAPTKYTVDENLARLP